MNQIFLGLCLYLLAIIIVSIWTVGKNKTHAEFLLADRKLGAIAITLSERASAESAWLVLGLPGVALAVGFQEIWTVLGCLGGIIFCWLFLAAPIRNLAGQYDSLTLPDLISNYFHDDKQILRVISSLIITFFFALYVAAQFSGAGKVLNVAFGIPPVYGILIGGGVIVVYTIVGGFRAVVWTDMIQAFLMFCTVVLLPVIGLIVLTSAPTTHLEELTPAILSVTGNTTGWLVGLGIIAGLSWGLGYTGQPHLLVRFMALRDVRSIRRCQAIAFTWAIPAFCGAFAMGIVGLALYGRQPFTDPEKIMPYMATNLLPGWLAGILISGSMAAMMSTADSQLLVATSALTEDLTHKIAKINLSPRQFVSLNRLVTLGVALLAFVLAFRSKDLVFALVSYAWSGLGASFGPVLVAMLYWKKVTREGAIAGMSTGAIATIIWKNIAGINQLITERFASYFLACLMIVIVSLMTRRRYAQR